MTSETIHHAPLYKQLIQRCVSPEPIRTAVVCPNNEQSLLGALEAADEHLIVPVLLGDKKAIFASAKKNGRSLESIEIIDIEDGAEAAKEAVTMAKEGRVKAIMKGHVPTHVLLHAIMSKENGLRTSRRMSHVFVINTPDYPKPLFLTDAAVNIHPTLTHKRDIIQNAIDLFLALGYEHPKVAVLSATEHVTESIPSTLEAAALSKMADRGAIRGGIVDGPLAFDNAISLEAAQSKGIRSDVAGHADILMVPDLESGNMLYKQMRYMAGYEAAGIVLGAQVPVILTSRAAESLTRMASCALALLYVSGSGQIELKKQKEAA
jgi:phosphotransacetylase